jgi:hypothetical protein
MIGLVVDEVAFSRTSKEDLAFVVPQGIEEIVQATRSGIHAQNGTKCGLNNVIEHMLANYRRNENSPRRHLPRYAGIYIDTHAGEINSQITRARSEFDHTFHFLHEDYHPLVYVRVGIVLLPNLFDLNSVFSMGYDPLIINVVPGGDDRMLLLAYQAPPRRFACEHYTQMANHFAKVAENRSSKHSEQGEIFVYHVTSYGLLNAGFAALSRGADYLQEIRDAFQMADLGI